MLRIIKIANRRLLQAFMLTGFVCSLYIVTKEALSFERSYESRDNTLKPYSLIVSIPEIEKTAMSDDPPNNKVLNHQP